MSYHTTLVNVYVKEKSVEASKINQSYSVNEEENPRQEIPYLGLGT